MRFTRKIRGGQKTQKTQKTTTIKHWEHYAKIKDSNGNRVNDSYFLAPINNNVGMDTHWQEINKLLKDHLDKCIESGKLRAKIIHAGFGGDDGSGYVYLEYVGRKEPIVPPMKFEIDGRKYTMVF